MIIDLMDHPSGRDHDPKPRRCRCNHCMSERLLWAEAADAKDPPPVQPNASFPLVLQ
jgi:hypothetical protein